MPIIQELNSDESDNEANPNMTTSRIVSLPQNNVDLAIPTVDQLFASCANQERSIAQQGNQIITASRNMCSSSSSALETLSNCTVIGAIGNSISCIANTYNVRQVNQTLRANFRELCATQREKYESLVAIDKHRWDARVKVYAELCDIEKKKLARETTKIIEDGKIKSAEIARQRDETLAIMVKEIECDRTAAWERIQQGRNALENFKLQSTQRMHQREQETRKYETDAQTDVSKYAIDAEKELQNSKQKMDFELAKLRIQLGQKANAQQQQSSQNGSRIPHYQNFFKAQFEEFQKQQQQQNIGNANGNHRFEAALILRCLQIVAKASSSSSAGNNDDNHSFTFDLLFQQRYKIECPINLLDLVTQQFDGRNILLDKGFILLQNGLDIAWNAEEQNADDFTKTIEQFLMANNWNLKLLVDDEMRGNFIGEDAFFGAEQRTESSHCYVISVALPPK